jgi:hypothetical protein
MDTVAERPAPGLRESRTGLAPERPSTCLRLSIRALITLREAALGPVQPYATPPTGFHLFQ